MARVIKPAPLIWINAFPGTGKFTIASILARKLMEGRCTLVHNHDLIDAVTYPRDHPEYRRLRKEERSKAFERHVLVVDTMERCVIFTGISKT
jgi:adenylylsulfate kinase-like enzyme